MRQITLSYALTIPATEDDFSDGIVYDVLEIYADLESKISGDDGESRRSDGVKCQILEHRYRIDIVFAASNFNPWKSNLDTATLQAKFLETWIGAPIKRLYIEDGSEHFISGCDLFDTETNTNYLNYISSSKKYEKLSKVDSSDIERKIVSWSVELETKNSVTLKMYVDSDWT
jgi:hypothetical protein